MEWKLSQLQCLCFRTGLIIVLTGLLIAFGILPLHRRIAEENDETQKIVVKMEHAREKVSRLGEYRGQYEKIDSRSSEVDLALPESDFASFIAELEATAQDIGGGIAVTQGPEIAALQKEAKKKEEADRIHLVDEMSGENALSLSIRFFGSYPETIAFLHRLETLPYYLDVLSMDLTARDGSSSGSKARSSTFLVGDFSGVNAVSDAPSGLFVDAVFNIVVYSE